MKHFYPSETACMVCSCIFPCSFKSLFILHILIMRSEGIVKESQASLPYHWLNPLSPHDALKHHFTSLKTDLIFVQQRVLE